MKPISRTACGAMLAATVVLVTLPARADVIMDWNAKADAIAVDKQLPPVPHGRGLAIMHLAMFEAVNAVERRYAPYRLTLTADRGTPREAAAAVAGHEVLAALHPDQKAALDATLAAALAGVADGEAKTKGIALGRRAAAEMLALRANDGSTAS